ncbi:MAG: metallophosphoesterase [Bacillota bacterium]
MICLRILKRLALLTLVLLGTGIFCWWQNNGLGITEIEYINSQIPQGFRGFRIVQVSDLHNKEFGHGNARLLAAIQAAQPDLVVITGDLVDRRRTDFEVARSFATQVAEIAPVYYVSGNHEQALAYGEFRDLLTGAGATVLDNADVILERQGEQIALLGLSDPMAYAFYADETFALHLADLVVKNEGMFTILLSHRPEKMSLYSHHGVDLVFSGHAHGGQFRLPFIGGLAAPHQGLFPKYTSGVYQERSTAMVVSRGLGNSLFPLRLFNRPELVVVTLRGE